MPSPINGEAAGEVARAARQVGAQLVHVSIDDVYDGSKQSAYVESDATGPQNVYGCSKLEGERPVLAEMPAMTILRMSWVVSPFGRNFVKTMLALAATESRRCYSRHCAVVAHGPLWRRGADLRR